MFTHPPTRGTERACHAYDSVHGAVQPDKGPIYIKEIVACHSCLVKIAVQTLTLADLKYGYSLWRLMTFSIRSRNPFLVYHLIQKPLTLYDLSGHILYFEQDIALDVQHGYSERKPVLLFLLNEHELRTSPPAPLRPGLSLPTFGSGYGGGCDNR